MDKRKKLEEQYKNVPILDEVVEKSLKKRKKRWQPGWIIVAAAVIIFIAGINASATFAKSMAQIPVLSSVVEVLAFTKFEEKDGNHEAKIEIPQITGNSEEIQALNAQYEEEGRALYEQYMEITKEMDGGHLSIESGYEVKIDNDQILSFGRYIVELFATSSTIIKYTTIDKEQQIAITLPSLFKDNSYVDIISTYIIDEMRKEMITTNLDKMYWVSGVEGFDASLIDGFQSIAVDQNFYITPVGKLVIAFDKYEVAPGYMGLVEFEIPTELIQDVLMSNTYIK